MARGSITLPGFVSGEISPRLRGRTDLQQFGKSLRRCENFITTMEGSLLRRPGTVHLGSTKTTTQNVVMLPFTFSSDISYLVEFGPAYARFWTPDGLLLDGGLPVEVATPYAGDALRDLRVAQDADVAYVVHPDHLPYKLRRLTATSFDMNPVTFLNGRAPLNPLNRDAARTITITGTWPTLTATASTSSFLPTDVGRALFVRDTTNKIAYYMTITAYTSATVVSATGNFRIGASNPAVNADWALGLFSSTEGCRAVAFHEGRLWYGGFTSAPDQIAGSVSNSFDNFEAISPDLTLNDAANADKSIGRRTTSGQVNQVLWIASNAEALAIGTGGGEFVVRPGTSGVLTPTEAAVKRASNRGSAAVEPVVIDDQVFFVQRHRGRLRRFGYKLEADNFRSEDANVLSSHLARQGFATLVYQQEPHSVLWGLMDTGILAGWTLEQKQEVLGAHRHRLGGSFEGGPPQIIAVGVWPGRGAAPRFQSLFGAEGGFRPHDNDDTWDFEGGTLAPEWDNSGGTNITASAGAGGILPATAGGMAAVAAATVGGSNTSVIARDFALSAIPNWSNDLTMAGRSFARASAQFARGITVDLNTTMVLRVIALTAADAVISTVTQEEIALQDLTVAGEWQTVLANWAQMPVNTAKIRVEVGQVSTNADQFDTAIDDVRLEIEQFPLVVGEPPGLGEDRLLLVVRRTIDGETSQSVEYLSPSFAPADEQASDDAKRDTVETGIFLDASLTLNPAVALSYAGETAGSVLFRTVTEHGLTPGDNVTLRGCLWLEDGEQQSISAGNYDVFTVATAASDFEFTLEDENGAPVDLALLGLAAGSFLVPGQAGVYRRFTTLSGLDHLEGLEVTALADGRPVGPLTVVGGEVTLPDPASIITVGLPYVSIGEPSQITGLGGQRGSDESQPVSISHVAVRLLASLGGEITVGADGNTQSLIMAYTNDVMGRPPVPLTGDIRVSGDAINEETPVIRVMTSDPYPMEVLNATVVAEARPL